MYYVSVQCSGKVDKYMEEHINDENLFDQSQFILKQRYTKNEENSR